MYIIKSSHGGCEVLVLTSDNGSCCLVCSLIFNSCSWMVGHFESWFILGIGSIPML